MGKLLKKGELLLALLLGWVICPPAVALTCLELLPQFSNSARSSGDVQALPARFNEGFVPELVADNESLARRFVDQVATLSDQRHADLGTALLSGDIDVARRIFDFSAMDLAIQEEIAALGAGMCFSLLRHGFEAPAFARTENLLERLWIGEGALYFSPGHGSPGALQSLSGSRRIYDGSEASAYLRVRLPNALIWDLVAETPAAERARVAFYGSCNAGLPDTIDGVYQASAAEQFARRLDRPVIAPLGVLNQLVTSVNPPLTWLSVYRREGTRDVLLERDQAFGIFFPDGTWRTIPFDEAMRMVSRPDMVNEYIGHNWNPDT